jgi:hypothetical protein
MEKRLIWLIGAVLAAGYLMGVFGVPATHGRIINGDAIQYYAYLRSAVFDRDLDFTNDYRLLYGDAGASTNSWINSRTPIGRPTNLMSVGPAILWAPFYLAAVLLVGAVGSAPLNGIEPMLQASVGLAGIFYATLGSCLTYRACALLFPRTAAFWATMVVWLAGSAVYYSFVSPTYSHATSLFAVSLFVYLWLKDYHSRCRANAVQLTPAVIPGPRSGTRNPVRVTTLDPGFHRGDDYVNSIGCRAGVVRRMLLLGALGGLVALVRWQDALVLLLPVAETAYDVQSKRVSFAAACARLAALGAAAAVAMIPQFLAWQAIYGTPLLIPQGSGFMRWSQPAILDVLFSLNHGLFSWTPALLLAGAGLPLLVKRDRMVGWPVVLVLVLTVYVNAVVQDWWAGEAFGARRFVGDAVLFALGLAALFATPRIGRRPRALAWIGSGLVVYNLLFLLQYQLFMRGMVDLVPYPTTARQVFVDRLLLPFQLLVRWIW